jgi:hypothetical protein
MNNRLTRTDYLVVYFLIILMAASIGSFFFGLNIGQNRTVAKYETFAEQKKLKKVTSEAYTEQDLASFYHTVYRPYDLFFQPLWKELESSQDLPTSKSWKKLTEETLKQISAFSVSDKSPLLVNAQTGYIQSLKSLLEALDQSSADLRGLLENQFYLESRKSRLKAQQDFFQAIMVWEQQYVTKKEPPESINASPFLLQNWGLLTLHQKNKVIARELYVMGLDKPYSPQDVTVNLDAFIRSGETKALSIKDVPRALKILSAAQSIRNGDFLNQKDQQYSKAAFPMIPFYRQSP